MFQKDLFCHQRRERECVCGPPVMYVKCGPERAGSCRPNEWFKCSGSLLKRTPYTRFSNWLFPIFKILSRPVSRPPNPKLWREKTPAEKRKRRTKKAQKARYISGCRNIFLCCVFCCFRFEESRLASNSELGILTIQMRTCDPNLDSSV